jgi:outer membrane protein
MTTAKGVLFGVLFCGLCGRCGAQAPGMEQGARAAQIDQGAQEKWDLQRCFDYAKANNIQLNTLRLSQQISRETLLQAKAILYPGVTGSMTQTYLHSNGANAEIAGTGSSNSFTSGYGLGSSWTIFNAGYLRDNVKMQRLGVTSAGLTTDEAGNDLTLQITQDFLGILLADETITYAADLLNTSKAQLQQGRDQFQAGSIAQAALVELQAQTAADEYNLVTAQNAYRQDVLALKQLLQLPTGYVMEIQQPDTAALMALAPAVALDSAVNDAMATRPEVRNGELGIEQAMLDLKMARAQEYPVAAIGATVATGYGNNEGIAYGSQTTDNLYERVGLSVSIPIFNNRLYRTQVNTSKLRLAQARLALTGTKTTLSQQVEQAYIGVLNSRSQYNAAATQLRASGESYRAAAEQFKAGAANYVDLLQQKTLYVQALQGYIQAKYTAVFDLLMYNFYRGVPVKL